MICILTLINKVNIIVKAIIFIIKAITIIKIYNKSSQNSIILWQKEYNFGDITTHN